MMIDEKICIEKTLCFIKPGVNRMYKRAIMQRLVGNFMLDEAKTMVIPQTKLRELYAHCTHLNHYEEMIEFYGSEPVTIMVLKGYNAVKTLRKIIGPTLHADKGTIRGDFGAFSYKNVIHASGSNDEFLIEYMLLFG